VVRTEAGRRPTPADLTAVDDSPLRCFDPAAEALMIAEVEAAAKAGDSLGGLVEVLAYGVPPGLGSHVHWDRKIDGLLAQALMSIQAMKGVEIGDGFEAAGLRGSQAHDEILWDSASGEYVRDTTRAGGTEGGMTSGSLLVARAAMKPLATLNKPVLKTVDTETKEQTVSFKERTDVTAVPAAGVVAETMVALVLANEVVRKFGGDSLVELTPQPHLPRVPVDAPRARRADKRARRPWGSVAPRCSTAPSSTRPARRGRHRATVAEIFATQGERAFRSLERTAVADACASPEPLVVACGGGAVLDPDNRRALREHGVVVWLRAANEELGRRVGAGEGRPLLHADSPADSPAAKPACPAPANCYAHRDARPSSELRARLQRPPRMWSSTPTASPSTRSPTVCWRSSARGTGDRRARPSSGASGNGPCDVVGEAPSPGPELLCRSAQGAVVSQAGNRRLPRAAASLRSTPRVSTPTSSSWATGRCEGPAHRRGPVLAARRVGLLRNGDRRLGGGVVGDTAGFVASVYHRGSTSCRRPPPSSPRSTPPSAARPR
jgi:hypothetical protein